MGATSDEDALADDDTAIRRLMAIYAHLLDDGRYEEWAELFTGDGSFTVWGNCFEGRAQIRDGVKGLFEAAGGSPGQHSILSSVIERSGPAAARAWTDFLFVGRTGESFGVLAAGRYYDELVLDGGRWRFHRRQVRSLGEAPPSGVSAGPAR